MCCVCVCLYVYVCVCVCVFVYVCMFVYECVKLIIVYAMLRCAVLCVFCVIRWESHTVIRARILRLKHKQG